MLINIIYLIESFKNTTHTLIFGYTLDRIGGPTIVTYFISLHRQAILASIVDTVVSIQKRRTLASCIGIHTLLKERSIV